MRRTIGVLGTWALVSLIAAPSVQAWSGGPLLNVSDLSPACSVCHSSMQKETLKFVPDAFAANQFVENKHYKQLEAGEGAYKDMTAADRQKLLADIKTMDANASVALSVPSSVRPGQEIQVTVTVRGGGGAVGVMLVDNDARYQSRAITGDGWVIVGEPKVWGADGKEQTRWLDRRGPGLRRNLNFVVIFDMTSDIAAKKFPEGKVTWTVRAPQDPGTYTMAVAFYYGTEKSSPVGRVERAATVLPRGGAFGPSGHMLFSKVHQITVR